MKFTQKGKEYTWICENKLCNRPLDADCTVVSTTEHVRRFCSMDCVVESFNNHMDEILAEGRNLLPVPLIGEKIAERIKTNNPGISETVGEKLVEYFKEEQRKNTPKDIGKKNTYIPDGMRKAFLDGINVRGMPSERITIASENALIWIMENPRIPTVKQWSEIYYEDPKASAIKRLEKWMRRMFVIPNSEISELEDEL